MSNNYCFYLQKALQRKRSHQVIPRKQSPLRECEEIHDEIEIMDECDVEVYMLLTNSSYSDDSSEFDMELYEMRKSSKTIFDE